METYPRAPALSLVGLELGETRVPQAGTGQTCLTGKGVTSGESWGVASRLCQVGSTGTTGKVTPASFHWKSGCLTESKLNAQGLQLLGLRRGRRERRQLWFLFVSPRMTVTPRGVGTMG